MRTLLLIIRKFKNLLLFVFLEILAIVLIINSKNMQGADILSSSNAIAGFFYKKKDDIVYYFKLQRVNADLVSENEQLKNKLAAYQGWDTVQNNIAKIPIVKIDSIKVADSGNTFHMIGERKIIRYASYEYIPAKVLNNSIASDNINYITINRGQKDGIKKDMAVVTYNGIVGRVVNVSNNFATVESILSKGRKLSTQLQDSTTGISSWQGGDAQHIIMENLPLNSKPKINDSVFATGYSYFPENILIGQIVAIDTNINNNKKVVTIKLSTNFRKLHNVYVVMNKFEDERRALEAKNPKED